MSSEKEKKKYKSKKLSNISISVYIQFVNKSCIEISRKKY